MKDAGEGKQIIPAFASETNCKALPALSRRKT